MSAAVTENHTEKTTVEEVKPVEVVDVPRTIVDPETTIFVGNVARECEESDLAAVFAEDVEVEIPSAKNGKSFKQRYAFVKFPSKIDFDAIKAKYDKTVVKDRGIYIRRAQTEEERDAKRKARISKPRKQRAERASANANANGVQDEGASGEPDAETSAADRKPARSAIPAPPKRQERTRAPLESMERTTDTLYVNNVPYMATKEQIAEFFGTSPELVVMPLRRMRNVKTKQYFYSKKMNRGIAFVTFENCSDIAQKVNDFQGKSFNDRELAVDVAALKPARENAPALKHDGESQEPVPESTAA
ncbi:LAME_0E05424g1_1 [Lachancea meyersii CBS 8951]|uniref:LAME_0E05424g1_1 n=1 Tax=Lachancea meyersii CBS 8951 TaxID=1266667 RepID=A0A1G4JHH1_9SACH|nr:LAME_0E05424g1_1 [Lachancea meyersii CBS 8951]